MKVLLVYLAAVSLASVILTAADKAAARMHKKRVPEKVLLLFAALGGSVSMYITMRLIRHKTRHGKFMIGIPVIFVLQVCLCVYLFRKSPAFF